MSDDHRKHTALGVARERFIEGLARKAAELKGAVALLVASPESERPREEMRRRLHALYASAQVFRMRPLAEALEACIVRIDAARDEGRALTQDDLDVLASLAVSLPRIGAEAESSPRPSAPPPAVRRVEPAADAPAPIVRLGVPTPASLARIRTETRAVVREAPAPVAVAPPVVPRPVETAALRVAEPAAIAHTDVDSGALVSVLVLDGADVQAQIRAALPAATYEILGTASPEEALRLARSSAPDVVLVDRAALVRGAGEFVARLRADLLTDFIPVVMLAPPGMAPDPIAARGIGADDVVAKPVDPPLLVRAIARVLGSDAIGGVRPLGDATLAQLADRLADEVRAGIAGSAEAGADLPVPLGDGAEVLAAAWSAIARVRAFVAARSGGRVRFRDPPRRGGPAVLALTDGDDALADDHATEVSLDGRRIVVVDDDPTVVWFFSTLLREAGAAVHEATDGREALAQLRAERADVVVSDIVMPQLDGFGLCREIQRDPALEGIPVILLSWKEDLLQRMRDLQAGASGYLRKEAGATQILARVRDALRPRARLEAQLRAGGEVRGSLERIGAQTLLRTVAAVCGDARVTVRDAWNLFEVDLRGSELVHLTRTATDGSFARGEGALRQLLGATAGRFVVAPDGTPARAMFRDPLAVLLDRNTRQLGALVDAVSGTGLPLADRVELDEDVLALLARTSPAPSRALIERLRAGESPRALVASGELAPQDVEAVLVDLARRGALVGVRGQQGEDRVAEALAARASMPDTPLASRARLPAASAPALPLRVPALPAALVAGSPSTEMVAPAAPPDAPPAAALVEQDELPTSPGDVPVPVEPLADPADVTSASEYPMALASGFPAPSASGVAVAAETPSMFEPAIASLSEYPTARPPVAEDADAEDASAGPSTVDERAHAHEGPAEAADADHDADADAESEDATATPHAEAPAAAAGPGGTAWLIILGSLAVLGFFGYRAWYDGTVARLFGLEPPGYEADAPPPADAPAGGERAVPTVGASRSTVPDGGGADSADAGTAVAPSTVETVVDPLRFGRVEPGIRDVSVTVGSDEGLLVVEAGSGGAAVVVLDGRELGPAPLRVAVSAGQHELSFRRGEEASYRFLNVRAAHTHTVTVP